MSDFGDRAVMGICLVAAGWLLAEMTGVVADRWAAHEMAQQQQTVCERTADRVRCVDVLVQR